MVENNRKKTISLRKHKLKAKLNSFYATKLDATTARMYSDDADIRQGALSVPEIQMRPGLRDDDESLRSFTKLHWAL